MDAPPKKERSKKEQMQLARARCLRRLGDAVADPATNLSTATHYVVSRLVTLYLNEANEAWPSASTLARDCGMDERTVRKHLDRAVESGFLTKKRVGRMQPNVYSLCFEGDKPASDRALYAVQKPEVTGSPKPLTLDEMIRMLEARSGQVVPAMGVARGHPVQVTVHLRQRDRANGATVTGSGHPANHLEENHEEEPRELTRDARTGARTRPCSSDSNSSLKLDTEEKSQPSNSERKAARPPDDDEDASAFA